MLKETFTFVDYNGNERTEDHYFHLNKAECMEMELGTTGGLTAYLQSVIDAQDMPTLIKIFKEMILKAYGKKSPDGRQFIKNDELSTEFSQTEAYVQLFTKLATDAEAASRFVNGIIPADMAAEVAKNNPQLLNGK